LAVGGLMAVCLPFPPKAEVRDTTLLGIGQFR